MKNIASKLCVLVVVAVSAALPVLADATDPVVVATTAAAADFQENYLLVLGAVASAALLMAGAAMTYSWAKATFFS